MATQVGAVGIVGGTERLVGSLSSIIVGVQVYLSTNLVKSRVEMRNFASMKLSHGTTSGSVGCHVRGVGHNGCRARYGIGAGCSASGRMLLWKHRDTGTEHSFVAKVEPCERSGVCGSVQRG